MALCVYASLCIFIRVHLKQDIKKRENKQDKSSFSWTVLHLMAVYSTLSPHASAKSRRHNWNYVQTTLLKSRKSLSCAETALLTAHCLNMLILDQELKPLPLAHVVHGMDIEPEDIIDSKMLDGKEKHSYNINTHRWKNVPYPSDYWRSRCMKHNCNQWYGKHVYQSQAYNNHISIKWSTEVRAIGKRIMINL